jgi:DHA2 family multidrug resistance protein
MSSSDRAASTRDVYHAPFSPWLIAIVATLATFMEVLDTSIANVALPHIAGNLGASINDSTWILTSYLVANAIVLPATAWLSSALGRSTYYMISVALFAVSSLACGFAQNLEMLVFFRLLQGLGGGGLQPLTQAILIDTFPPRLRGMGMAVYGMTVVVAPVIGPTFGGWITDNYDWRWIFLINVPIGAIALLLSTRYITDPPYLVRRSGERRWRGDLVGLGLFAVGLGAMQLVLDLGDRLDWFSSPVIVWSAIASGVALIAGVLWELDQREPMVDLRVLRDRNLRLSFVHMLIFGAVLFGTTALLPLLMQTLLGYTAEQSGLALSPGGMVIAVLMPLVGFLVARVDVRWMIAFGVVVISYAMWRMSQFTSQVDFRAIVEARIIQGFGLAFVFVPINTIAYANVEAHDRNSASSLMSIARNVGGSIGIGYSSAMLTRGAQAAQSVLVRNATTGSQPYAQAHAGLAAHFLTATGDPERSSRMAHAVLADVISEQARLLAYLHQFALLSIAFLSLLPIVFLMRRRAPTGHAEVMVE